MLWDYPILSFLEGKNTTTALSRPHNECTHMHTHTEAYTYIVIAGAIPLHMWDNAKMQLCREAWKTVIGDAHDCEVTCIFIEHMCSVCTCIARVCTHTHRSCPRLLMRSQRGLLLSSQLSCPFGEIVYACVRECVCVQMFRATATLFFFFFLYANTTTVLFT